MDLRTIPNLNGYLEVASVADDADERACAQNFLLDERPAATALDLYRPHFDAEPVSDLNDWNNRHWNFATDHLYIDPDESDVPATFRPFNAPNRVPEMDKRLNLIRVETATDSFMLRGHSFDEVRAQVDAYRSGDTAAEGFLQALCTAWNDERDQRPTYVTTEIEVEDILADGVDDWAVQLRDRLGLGHLDPGPSGRPIEVLLMRYSVAEVVATLEGNGHPAIPTVFDGGISRYFFPSPRPGPDAGMTPMFGRTVNLSPVDNENEYRMGCELLHPRIEYRPEHFYRAGIIAERVTMPLSRARSFHLPWVRLYAERDDFGADVFGVDGA